MAAKPIDPNIEKNVVADWRTGHFSQRQLASKYKISAGKVANLTKGIEKDSEAIVSAGVQYRCGLAQHDERMMSAIESVVDEKTKHILFFNNAALQNVKESMEFPCESQQDFRNRAETINKGRETVLGKSPDTAIQINHNESQQSFHERLKAKKAATLGVVHD